MKSGLYVEGLTPLLRELNALGRDINREIRAETRVVADEEAGRLRSASLRSDQLSAAVGVTIRSRSDRVPAIVGGGARRVHVSGRPKAGSVFFGAEFGGGKRKTTRQFRPHRGRHGYWLWPQLRRDSERMMKRWTETLERVVNDAARRAGR